MIYTTPNKLTSLTSAGYLDNPFVGYNNLAAAATLSGTAVLTDGARENATTGTTYDYWKPNVTGTACNWIMTLGTAQTVGFVGLAAHNLGTLGAGVQIWRSTDGGATWNTTGLAVQTPTDNSPIGFRMVDSGQDATMWRVNITNLTAGAPLYIGVIYMGPELVFPRRFYKDFAPVLSPTEVQLQSNVSAGGNLLGNSIVTKGSTLSAQFQVVDSTFVRGSMLPFQKHFNGGNPFFFGWRPTTYPADLHYCWREGEVIRPANSGPLAYMSFNMQMRAFEA